MVLDFLMHCFNVSIQVSFMEVGITTLSTNTFTTDIFHNVGFGVLITNVPIQKLNGGELWPWAQVAYDVDRLTVLLEVLLFFENPFALRTRMLLMFCYMEICCTVIGFGVYLMSKFHMSLQVRHF